MNSSETPRKPRRKPGNVTVFDAHYIDFRRREERPSGWKIGPDGKKVPKGRRWQVRYIDQDGKQRFPAFETKAEATAERDRIASELHTGTYIDKRKSAALFSEMADTWTASLIRKAESTRENYGSVLRNHVLPYWGSRELGGITHGDVVKWVGDITPKMAPATVHRCYQVLAGVLHLAVRDGRIRANPARDVELPKIEEEEKHYLDHAEVARLAAAADYLYSLRTNRKRVGRDRSAELAVEHDRDGVPIIPAAGPSPDGLAIRFMAYTGLRIGEFSALRVKNLDLDGLHVRVFEAYTDVKGKLVLGLPKGDKKRTLNLVPRLVDELRAHVKGKAADALVFTAATGGPIRRTNWNKRVLHPAAKLAGLYIADDGETELTAHDLRHTYASLCASAGISSRSIADWMGHASTAITESVYIDLFPKDLKAHAALLDAAMSSGSS
ncbi:tyrosine-type recombinase/integrase [Nocardia amikacinitolerans]|uniref:tyrosine-type recombinase/integrase n=1 Tax=Nocardia amikacinitolerans TaxID=756689 RepID=UPI0020A45D20|nr:site-specific integrase [Nocardia amikacinitolerans]MCP2279122.1 Site-specific recombinase XerD [Nocardia amikacinitolerans]